MDTSSIGPVRLAQRSHGSTSHRQSHDQNTAVVVALTQPCRPTWAASPLRSTGCCGYASQPSAGRDRARITHSRKQRWSATICSSLCMMMYSAACVSAEPPPPARAAKRQWRRTWLHAHEVAAQLGRGVDAGEVVLEQRVLLDLTVVHRRRLPGRGRPQLGLGVDTCSAMSSLLQRY
eukprot:COSAG01_NODE_497_length_16267_cov_5.357558_21_plen_177_part_00